MDGVLYSYNYWFVVSGVSGIKVTGMPVISSQLVVGDLDDGLALYHSRTGLSNDESLAKMPVIQIDKDGNPIERETPKDGSGG